MPQPDNTHGSPAAVAPAGATAAPVAPAGAPGSLAHGTPHAPAAKPARRKPPAALLVVVVAGLAVGGYFLGKWYMHRQAYVGTDDAQVSGNLVSCSSRVPGRIAELLVDEGQEVRAGQVVARLDEADFRAQLNQAEAALAVARSGLTPSQTGVWLQTSQTSTQIIQAESALRSAKAQLSAAQANATKAHSDLSRVQKLAAAGGIAMQALEAARAAGAAADAAVQSTSSQVRSAEEGLALAKANTQTVAIKQASVDTVQAQIRQAEAAVATARLQLSHTTLTSPVNGLIARRIANLGEQVSPGQALFSISQTDHVWISAYVEETQIRRVKLGAPVEVRIDAYPKQEFKGKVSFVGAVTGGQFSLLPANNAAGNFTKVVQRIPVKIAVEDPQHQLKPGMSAVIDIDARGV